MFDNSVPNFYLFFYQEFSAKVSLLGTLHSKLVSAMFFSAEHNKDAICLTPELGHRISLQGHIPVFSAYMHLLESSHRNTPLHLAAYLAL